jgi:hypothetical protein
MRSVQIARRVALEEVEVHGMLPFNKGGSRMVDWGGPSLGAKAPRLGDARGEAPTFEGPREVGGVLAPPQKFFFNFSLKMAHFPAF